MSSIYDKYFSVISEQQAIELHFKTKPMKAKFSSPCPALAAAGSWDEVVP